MRETRETSTCDRHLPAALRLVTHDGHEQVSQVFVTRFNEPDPLDAGCSICEAPSCWHLKHVFTS